MSHPIQLEAPRYPPPHYRFVNNTSVRINFMANLKDKVYKLTSQIPSGRVSTYKAIGDAIGTKAYRAIGQILSVNPYAPEVPCHRVVKSNGEVGGFMGKVFDQKKENLLKTEGIRIESGHILNFEQLKYANFD